MYFQQPGRNSKNLEEIQKTWKKLSKNLWQPCIMQTFNYIEKRLVCKYLKFKEIKIF